MRTVNLPRQTSGNGRGFTLVEILVSVGIFAILLGLILANYRRGSDDSVLARETLLLMSRVRLAQEQSAAGAVAGYCELGNSDAVCTQNSDCTGGACNPSTPSGGFGIFASCSTGETFNDNHWPDRNHYWVFADRVQCQRDCFPFNAQENLNWDAPNDAFHNIDAGTDHLFSSSKWGAEYRGDTIGEEFTLDAKVTLLDLRLSEAGDSNKAVTCNSKSAWKGILEPSPMPALTVDNNYPLQAVVHFQSPDGRSTTISDNVSTKTPVAGVFTGKVWGEAHFMLALKARPTQDCQVVRVTKDGIVTKYIDADCQF